MFIFRGTSTAVSPTWGKACGPTSPKGPKFPIQWTERVRCLEIGFTLRRDKKNELRLANRKHQDDGCIWNPASSSLTYLVLTGQTYFLDFDTQITPLDADELVSTSSTLSILLNDSNANLISHPWDRNQNSFLTHTLQLRALNTKLLFASSVLFDSMNLAFLSLEAKLQHER